jgi:hypothetical protein
MKKMFKLLLCAAIVAAGFTACSEEVTPIDPEKTNPNGGTVVEGLPTSASFSFSVPQAVGTKGLTPDASELTTLDNYRILVFDNATGKLEVDTARAVGAIAGITNDTIITIELISGTKKIYVFANGGTTTASLNTPAKGAGGFDYTNGNLSQINGIYNLTATTTPPLANLELMHALYTSGKFFFSSNAHEAVIVVQPGITGPQSEVDGNANRFYIALERPVAKVAIRQSANASAIPTVDGKGTITANTIKYKMWGVNARMYPFQSTGALGILTPEYIPQLNIDPDTKKNYAREQGDLSSNAFINIAYSTAATAQGATSGNRFYYIPENNPSQKKKGNTTFANIEAVYLPKGGNYVTGIAYNSVTGVFTKTLGSGDLTTVANMYLFYPSSTGMDENTLFAGPNAENLAKKVYFHIKNPTTPENTTLSWYATAVDFSATGVQADFNQYFNKYTDSKAYYRLDIGQQTGTGAGSLIDNIVRRNWYYECNITGFQEIGKHTPDGLSEPEDEDLRGLTNISVTITIRDWSGTSISQIV